MANGTKHVYDDPAGLLSKLIRFNTVNPPGNEKDCIFFIRNLLAEAGIDSEIAALDPGRPNLIARLRGNNDAPPLLLYGHADVVGVQNQEWSCPPFEGMIGMGCVWGRGAVDMKGALAMMICAMLKIKADGFVPAGDVILAVFSDEEEFSEYGSRYVVNTHAGLFDGVRHAIGEIGGFSYHLNNRRYYPIMVAEKQKCSLKIRITGKSGHGSMPVRKQAMSKLSYVLKKLDERRLPVHITPVISEMLEIFSRTYPFPSGLILKGLANPLTADLILDLLGEKGDFFDPLLHNTANVTVIKTGDKINVVPGEITVELDGRLLPGLKPEILINEIAQILGGEFRPEVTYHAPGPEKTDMELYPLLSKLIMDADKDAVTLPYMISGCTDGAHLSRLGIQTYGFTPLLLPPDLKFTGLFHGPDERVPVNALEWGTEIIIELLKQYGADY